MCGAQLVVAERLRRRQIQRTRPGVGCQRVEHGKLIGQRLSRRRAGAYHHVAAGVRQLGGLSLV